MSDPLNSENEIRDFSFRKRISANNPDDLPSIHSKREKDILERRNSLPPINYDFQELEIDIPEKEPPNCKQKIRKFLRLHWSGIIIVVMLTIVIIRLASSIQNLEKRCWCIFVVLFLWSTDAIPSPITGIIPIAVFPLLNLISSDCVPIEYLCENTVLMLCANIVASVIESSKLHKLIAVRLLLIVGYRVKTIHAILMAFTFIIGTFCEETFVSSIFSAITKAILIIMEEEGICSMYERKQDDE